MRKAFRLPASLGGTLLALALHAAPAGSSTESIEFVSEHLAEIAMDDRYATLPLWNSEDSHSSRSWEFSGQAALAKIHSGALDVEGPMLALGGGRPFAGDWRFNTFVFFDDLHLSGGVDLRPLDVTFAPGVPLALPAAAEFAGLDGSARNFGFGLAVRHAGEFWPWHSYEWTAGVLWQRVALRNYSFDFQILDGPDAGSRGTLDYSANYSHVAPFVGLAWPREHGNWRVTPHLLAAMPLPRRGVVGRIMGAGYDLRGDTGAVGDKPFGDPSLTFGFDLTYRPWNLTLDAGSVLSQALLEPLIHEGVDRNWLISGSWSY